MTQHPDHLLDAAAGWLARTNDPEFADWDGFMAWLEADPAHPLEVLAACSPRPPT